MKNKAAICILLICTIILGGSIQVLGLAVMDNGGNNGALELVESTPADGSKAVEPDVQIRLLFNKNVVNMAVKDNNSKCFRVLDESNLHIPIDVIFADDQIEPDKKREILLKTREPLKENMTYKVEILPELQAKNGNILGKTVYITFSTLAPEISPAVTESTKLPEEKKEPAAVEVQPAETIEKAVDENTEADDTKAETKAEDSTAVAEAEKTQLKESGIPVRSIVLPVLVVGIAAAAGVAIFMVKKRKP